MEGVVSHNNLQATTKFNVLIYWSHIEREREISNQVKYPNKTVSKHASCVKIKLVPRICLYIVGMK